MLLPHVQDHDALPDAVPPRPLARSISLLSLMPSVRRTLRCALHLPRACSRPAHPTHAWLSPAAFPARPTAFSLCAERTLTPYWASISRLAVGTSRACRTTCRASSRRAKGESEWSETGQVHYGQCTHGCCPGPGCQLLWSRFLSRRERHLPQGAARKRVAVQQSVGAKDHSGRRRMWRLDRSHAMHSAKNVGRGKRSLLVSRMAVMPHMVVSVFGRQPLATL